MLHRLKIADRADLDTGTQQAFIIGAKLGLFPTGAWHYFTGNFGMGRWQPIIVEHEVSPDRMAR